MNNKRIWTIRDLPDPKLIESDDDFLTFCIHHPHVDHCGGWEVAAWPCPEAAEVLDRLHEQGHLR